MAYKGSRSMIKEVRRWKDPGRMYLVPRVNPGSSVEDHTVSWACQFFISCCIEVA